MITIKNCNTTLYECNGQMAYATFEYDQQTYETMLALGRGTPTNSVSSPLLCYKYKTAHLFAWM